MSVLTGRNVRRVLGALRRGKFSGLLGLVTELFAGHNLWIDYLARFKTVDGLVPFEVNGVTLYLDPTDRGISRQLLTYGIREEAATRVIRQQTRLLRETIDGPVTALDIGANRGYYAFQIADLLGNHGTVYAIEPEPRNVASLRHGVRANTLGNVVIDAGAIGATDGTADLQVSDRSNAHTLETDIPRSQEGEYRSTIEVPRWSIATFLERHELAPEAINLVKVDVEGYEPAVIESLAPVFEAGGPEVLFVELHPHRVATADLHDIVETIEAYGFEIIMASSSASEELGSYESVRKHLESEAGSHTVELVVGKPGIDEDAVTGRQGRSRLSP